MTYHCILIVRLCVDCGTQQDRRLCDQDEKAPANSVIAMPDQRPVQAGLLVIADKADPGSAPGLPDEALTRFREDLKQELGHGLPFSVKDLIQAEGISPNRTGGDLTQFRELGRRMTWST